MPASIKHSYEISPDEHAEKLSAIYNALNDYFGDLRWWPGESRIEIIIGAILTQNTAWRNVEIAIDKLRSRELLNQHELLKASDETIEELIKPSGYYHIKTKRLKEFVKFLFDHYDGSLTNLFSEEVDLLRNRLLKVKGIGEETADSIILYAGNKLLFVVDAYTRRILERHSNIGSKFKYWEVQKYFMDHLPRDVYLYKQYHALLVNTGKKFCTKVAKCEACPLRLFNHS